MITNDKIEEYLIDTQLTFEQVQEGMWLIHDEHDFIDNIVVLHTPPVLTFRVKIMELADIPESNRAGVFKQLLALNATEMVAGAYGLEDDALVITDSLQSENLDYNEFQASIDSITMSIREHYERIRNLWPEDKDEEQDDLSGRELEESIMGGN